MSALLVADSTTNTFGGRSFACLPHSPVREDSRCTAEPAEAWEDFERKNQVSVRLGPRFDHDLTVVLIPRSTKQKLDCKGADLISLSRVGFDRERKFAVVSTQYTSPCGGSIASSTVVLRRDGIEWHFFSVGMSGIS